jgi:23S rRNA pseudouridine1911/1915/1917 synthase
MALHVLYEDNHLLALAKPAGLATMGTARGAASLFKAAQEYIRQKYQKPGNVYLGVVSRLDAPVTGVVLFARTSKAAGRLAKLFREGQVRKVYWAVVERPPAPPQGTCQDWLRKNERRRRMEVCGEHESGAKLARLTYRVLDRLPRGALVEIELLTGRKHQIRVQLAHRGWPVMGDRKYGARGGFTEAIALHSRRLELRHPVRGTPLLLVAKIPADWRRFGLRQEDA